MSSLHGEHKPLTELVTVAPGWHQGDSRGSLEVVTPKAGLEQSQHTLAG